MLVIYFVVIAYFTARYALVDTSFSTGLINTCRCVSFGVAILVCVYVCVCIQMFDMMICPCLEVCI